MTVTTARTIDCHVKALIYAVTPRRQRRMRPKISTRLEPSTQSWEKAESMVYLSRNEDVTARRASTKDTLSSSGTRNRRSFAMRVSSTATTAARITSLTSRLATAKVSAPAVKPAATPHGTNRLLSSEKKISSLRLAAHSISAR